MWDSRQRRPIHTDTGSLEQREQETAEELRFPNSRQATTIPLLFTFALERVCMDPSLSREVFGLEQQLPSAASSIQKCVG